MATPSSMQSHKYCFTIYPISQDIELAEIWQLKFDQLPDFENSYGWVNLEICPTTKALHYQGFVVFNKNVRGNRLLEALKTIPGCKEPHIETIKGSIADNEEYCSKTKSRAPGTDPYTWGTRPKDSEQGKRNDLNSALDFMRDLPRELPPQAKLRRLARTQAHGSAFVRMHRGLAEFAAHLEEPEPIQTPAVWKPWQEHLRAALALPPHNRTIYWIYDPSGNQGKSLLALWYVSREMAISLEGRLENMTYLYQKQRIVFFDIPRAGSEHCDHLYRMGELLKNGFLTSTKYTPCQKIFAPPHVVYLSNSPPPQGAWSGDRLVTYTLTDDQHFQVSDHTWGAGHPHGVAIQNPPAFHSHSEAIAQPISVHSSSTENPFFSLTIPDLDDLSQTE